MRMRRGGGRRGGAGRGGRAEGRTAGEDWEGAAGRGREGRNGQVKKTRKPLPRKLLGLDLSFRKGALIFESSYCQRLQVSLTPPLPSV